jgi:hypothetical protein
VHHWFGSRGILQSRSLPHDFLRRGGGSRPNILRPGRGGGRGGGSASREIQDPIDRDPIVVMERLEHPRAIRLDRVGPRESIRSAHPRSFVAGGARIRSRSGPRSRIIRVFPGIRIRRGSPEEVGLVEPPEVGIDLRGVCPYRGARSRGGCCHQRDPCSRSSGPVWFGDPTRSFRRQPGGI